MTTPEAERDEVVAHLRRHLIGPVGGPGERLRDEPNGRYLTGILYAQPQQVPGSEPDDDLQEEEVESPGNSLTEDADDPITLTGHVRPSSIGITFIAPRAESVFLELDFGYYEPDGSEWIHQSGSAFMRLRPDSDGRCSLPVPEGPPGLLTVKARWRPLDDASIVTVALVNMREQPPRRRVDPAECVYQVHLRCRPESGRLRRYPTRRHGHRDPEAEELELQYRDGAVYAIGHGVAADWDRSEGEPAWVETTFLPVTVVPDVAFEVPGDPEALRLSRLASIVEDESVISMLDDFIDGYERWAQASRRAVESIPDHLRAAAAELVARMDATGARMRRGVRLLDTDTTARTAFGLANHAMAMQMVHGSASLAGSPHPLGQAPVMPDGYETRASWRPFQLGFLLLTIDGVVNGDSADRDLVDLIWFPTGGGKTEAYLGLAAFTILHRRLSMLDDGAGTTIITRYTLRLLTTQQFQRAATMALACEVLRRRNPFALGGSRISIGIWVGANSTPNTYAEAVTLLRDMRAGRESTVGFQVEHCPWCGTELMPPGSEEDTEWGIHTTNTSIRFRCLNSACEFHDEIPIASVDQALYDEPPTLLVGTVDKFARLAWHEKAGVFLGAGEAPGPSLVIQDEFHLISGPLGTIVGLYEAAFDVVMRHHGARPKLVAATATIRRADDQTRGVFGRKVALFPPAGLEAGESYFVTTDRRKPGRMYVGVMPHGHTHVMALNHTAAALLQAPTELALSPSTLDGYSTLVVYHNSLRELGKTITLAHDDFPTRIRSIAPSIEQARELKEIRELTSRVPAREIPRILNALALRHDERGSITMIAATNMISVGVDVGRLALMLVDGQPKTTAEYIQATSRVGRESEERPGLVLTLYSPAKPRDRSHYESFTAYHAVLYNAVEPSSVTPFSISARNRALHADLVILVRHALGLAEEHGAAKFERGDPELERLITAFLKRAATADSSEIQDLTRHLDRLQDDWMRKADLAATRGGLVYSGREDAQLLKRFLRRGDAWETLDSMRSVDLEIPILLEGNR
ncbi:hypothetical protein Afil01_02040 [Actinorhabdospora filicis]|uniref:Helicase C-terminal domain-containing protein n=1 Tax=Actinorhabdospora filicis TaxID=1785913 RepID=A0A9W6W117_9ACTN|nr:helicase-related protein [Actinorhabdospora filicis]GLZ75397.1 hypothetical protein Afil01_02040 [Actinorhabdospora filicis]